MSTEGNPRRAERVLAVVAEATEPALVERWCDEGDLPVLRALRERGSYRRLLSTTEIGSGATWPSLFGGVSPAKHGMAFYHRQIESGTYHIVKKYSDDVGRRPFWESLAKSGRRVVVLDVPESEVVPGFNGAHVAGWGVEALNSPAGSWPPELFDDINKRFGRHPLAGWYQHRPTSPEEWKRFALLLVEAVRTRTRVARHMLDLASWDLAFLNYSETHWGGHYFWHVIDPEHPEHDADVARLCGDVLRDMYREMDRALGELMAHAPGASVVFLSNTGMGPNYSGQHLLPEVLERLGRGPQQGRRVSPLARFLPAGRWGPSAVKNVERMVGPKRIQQARRLVPERLWDRWTRRFLAAGSNWPQCQAFCLPNDFTGAIRINLAGREPAGLVAAADYDRVCAELAEELGELVNPATGGKAVRRVIKVRECHRGDAIDALPDLIVQWMGDAPIDALRSPRIGTVEGLLPDKRTGAHQPYGFLAAAGPGLATAGALQERTIMDIAPTILQLLGAPVPADMDGAPMLDLIAD